MSKKNIPLIKIYGATRCHKTQFYIKFLNETGWHYEFLDIEKNKDHAEELRGLFKNRKLNFPTITIGSKVLRNPKTEHLETWLTH